MAQRPWRVDDPQAGEHGGVGALNLIRKDAYERIGTHRAIRTRPDDDRKLAKLVKGHGFRQGVTSGAGLVSVEWHRTLPGAVRGLSKSVFSALDYRISATVAGVLIPLLTNVLPAFGLFSRNPTGILPRLNILPTFLVYAYRANHLGDETPRYAILSILSVFASLPTPRSGPLHHDHQRGNRVAGDTISSWGVEGERDLIRAYGPPQPSTRRERLHEYAPRPFPTCRLPTAAVTSGGTSTEVVGGSKRADARQWPLSSTTSAQMPPPNGGVGILRGFPAPARSRPILAPGRASSSAVGFRVVLFPPRF